MELCVLLLVFSAISGKLKVAGKVLSKLLIDLDDRVVEVLDHEGRDMVGLAFELLSELKSWMIPEFTVELLDCCAVGSGHTGDTGVGAADWTLVATLHCVV